MQTDLAIEKTFYPLFSFSFPYFLPTPALTLSNNKRKMLAARSKLILRSLSARPAMQISDTMLNGLIEQANQELNASNVYLSMSLWFNDQELPGSATWCRTHSDEERDHALRIFDHIVKRRAKGALIRNVDPKQSFDFKTPADAWYVVQSDRKTKGMSVKILLTSVL